MVSVNRQVFDSIHMDEQRVMKCQTLCLYSYLYSAAQISPHLLIWLCMVCVVVDLSTWEFAHDENVFVLNLSAAI